MEIRRITSQGHTQGINIPTKYLKPLHLKKGDYVLIFINEKNQLVLEKVDAKTHSKFYLPGIGEVKGYGKK